MKRRNWNALIRKAEALTYTVDSRMEKECLRNRNGYNTECLRKIQRLADDVWRIVRCLEVDEEEEERK